MTDERAHDARDPVPTGVELTALDPAFRADPYPLLARLREGKPVHHDQVIERWVLTRADDVERVLRDRSMSVDPLKELAIAAILGRFPRLRLADEALEWRALPGFRGLAKLWVRAD
jgi:cytochrome P450